MKLNKKDVEKAIYLENNGRFFSKELKKELDVFYNSLENKNSYFAITLGISLTWTKHAKYNQDFVEYAAGFIDGKISKNEQIINDNAYRFGYEGLEIALRSYRVFLRKVKPNLIDFNNCTVDELTKLQHKLLDRVTFLKRKGEILGIGPWLFLGPFKIIVNHQERLWDKPNLNDIVLATGVEVERGMKRLKSEDYSFMKDFDLNWLEQGSRELLVSYGTCSILHERMKKIAEIAQTTVIHINSGLHLYGKKDI
ncbi:hypothetical protein [Tenacibaculum mesophilum]|uniref:hypothetical protein n=1 Tax=Tenacibaculum mesophilum TaxID=104268 RepID=UPI00249119EA|nr:hypothetical protein [Tenacibaculum mesophilum]